MCVERVLKKFGTAESIAQRELNFNLKCALDGRGMKECSCECHSNTHCIHSPFKKDLYSNPRKTQINYTAFPDKLTILQPNKWHNA